MEKKQKGIPVKPPKETTAPAIKKTEEPIRSINGMQIALMFAIVIALNLLFFPGRKSLIDHTPHWPDAPSIIIRDSIMLRIDTVKPQVVLVGNSMVGRSVHPEYFNTLTKIPTLILAPGGSGSAWWYLAFKNMLCVKQIPTVAFFFRDNELTDPTYNVTDEYKSTIDLMCSSNEPLLDRLAYYNNMSDFELKVNQNWPLYQKRKEVKTDVDAAIKKKVYRWFSDLKDGNAQAPIDRMFADTNMNVALFTKFQFKSDKRKHSEFDFKTALDKSFLPEILALAKQNNIKLIFVRVKRRRDVIPNSQPPELVAYINDLTEYFKKENIVFIDYTSDKRITEDFYSDGDHMDRHDRPMYFTQMVADTLPRFYAGGKINVAQQTGEVKITQR